MAAARQTRMEGAEINKSLLALKVWTFKMLHFASRVFFICLQVHVHVSAVLHACNELDSFS